MTKQDQNMNRKPGVREGFGEIADGVVITTEGMMHISQGMLRTALRRSNHVAANAAAATEDLAGTLEESAGDMKRSAKRREHRI